MRDAYEQITSEGFVVLGVSVETNLNNIRLVEYANQNGFNWRYTVASEGFLGAIVAQYGSQSIVPPSTPHFVLSSTGNLGPLQLGQKGSSEILNELRAAG